MGSLREREIEKKLVKAVKRLTRENRQSSSW